MGFAERSIIELGDSASTDAFGRLRTSGIGNRLDCEFLYGKQPEYFDEVTSGGSVTWNSTTRDLTLDCGSSNGNEARMQSYPVPCTPGDSHLIEQTGVLDFNAAGGGTASIFVRTSTGGSASEDVTLQPSWDGLNSGVDWTKSQIFEIDLRSLKVGRIRFFLVQNGVPVKALEIYNDNVRNSGYWQTATLPCYFRIYTSGGTTYREIGYGDENNAVGWRYAVTATASATMKAICCTVKSEGGARIEDIPGIPRSADMGTSSVSVTGLRPLISIRSASLYNTVNNLIPVRLASISVLPANSIRLLLYEGCSLANLTGESFGAVADSSVEVDTSATAFAASTPDGRLIGSQYMYADSAGSGSSGAAKQFELGRQLMWNRQGSESGIYTLAAEATGGASATFAAFNWEELR